MGGFDILSHFDVPARHATAIYGGYRFLDNNGDHEIIRETLFSDSFMVSWSNGPVAETLEANVVCADFPPLR